MLMAASYCMNKQFCRQERVSFARDVTAPPTPSYFACSPLATLPQPHAKNRWQAAYRLDFKNFQCAVQFDHGIAFHIPFNKPKLLRSRSLTPVNHRASNLKARAYRILKGSGTYSAP